MSPRRLSIAAIAVLSALVVGPQPSSALPCTWIYETVAPYGNSTHISLGVDANHEPRVVYQQVVTGKTYVVCAQRSGGAWASTIVDSLPAAGLQTLAVAPDGTPHVVYLKSGVIRHAWLSAGAWSIEDLPAQGTVSGLAVALNALGEPRLAIGVTVTGGTDIRYGERTGGAWTVTTGAAAQAGTSLGGEHALVLDFGDEPHVLLYRTSSSLPYHEFRSAGVWHQELIASLTGTDVYAGGASLAMDASGLFHCMHEGYCSPCSNGYHLYIRSRSAAGVWSGGTVNSYANSIDTRILYDAASSMHEAYYTQSLTGTNELGYSDPTHACLARDTTASMPVQFELDGYALPHVTFIRRLTTSPTSAVYIWYATFDHSVAVEISNIAAGFQSGAVDLAWFAAGGGQSALTLQRRVDSAPWTDVAAVSADGGGVVRFHDTDVAAAGDYGYRLASNEAGTPRYLGEVHVTVPVVTSLALAPVAPNPSGADAALGFSLPDAKPTRLEVVDVSGRVLLSQQVGGMGAGWHSVRMSDGRALRPGFYLVRLSREDGTRVRQFTVVH